MCVHCHLEIDDNVQNRKKVLQQRNKSAESEKCGIKHWSFDDEKWLSHREMESTRKRNVTWQKQIDYQGQGKMSGGSYAFDEEEFHTDKEKFWHGESGMSGDFASKFVFGDEDPNPSSSSSSNQVPVSAANVAQSGNRYVDGKDLLVPKMTKNRPWADETDLEYERDRDQSDLDREYDFDDDRNLIQRQTKW